MLNRVEYVWLYGVKCELYAMHNAQNTLFDVRRNENVCNQTQTASRKAQNVCI